MKLHIHHDDAGNIVSIAVPNAKLPHVGLRTRRSSATVIVDAADVRHAGQLLKIADEFRVEHKPRGKPSLQRK